MWALASSLLRNPTLLVAGLAVAAFACLVLHSRSLESELQTVKAASAAQVLVAKQDVRDAGVTTDSAIRFSFTQRDAEATNFTIQTRLADALRKSDLARRRLDRDLVRLHDAAATRTAPPAGDPAPPEGEGGETEAAEGGSEPTVGDLMTRATENYEICNRTADRLDEIQVWYEALRAGRAHE